MPFHYKKNHPPWRLESCKVVRDILLFQGPTTSGQGQIALHNEERFVVGLDLLLEIDFFSESGRENIIQQNSLPLQPSIPVSQGQITPWYSK
jgi:hypothetical protein